MNGLDTLVKMRGGVNNLGLDGCLKHGIACNITTAALLIDYKIPDHLVGWDPPEQTIAELYRWAKNVPHRHGRAFVPLVGQDGLSQGLVDVCLAEAEVSALLDSDCRWTEEEQLKICEMFHAIQLQFHKLTTEAVEMQKPVAPTFKIQRIRECTRHAALLYLAVLREMPVGGTPFQVMLKKTKALLAGTDLDGVWGGGERGGLLLWILIISGSVVDLKANDRKWFCRSTKDVARKLGVETWEEAREICKGFLWAESTCEKICSRFWSDCFVAERIEGC